MPNTTSIATAPIASAAVRPNFWAITVVTGVYRCTAHESPKFMFHGGQKPFMKCMYCSG